MLDFSKSKQKSDRLIEGYLDSIDFQDSWLSALVPQSGYLSRDALILLKPRSVVRQARYPRLYGSDLIVVSSPNLEKLRAFAKKPRALESMFR